MVLEKSPAIPPATATTDPCCQVPHPHGFGHSQGQWFHPCHGQFQQGEGYWAFAACCHNTCADCAATPTCPLPPGLHLSLLSCVSDIFYQGHSVSLLKDISAHISASLPSSFSFVRPENGSVHSCATKYLKPLVLQCGHSIYLLFSNAGKNTDIFWKIGCMKISCKHIIPVHVQISRGAGIHTLAWSSSPKFCGSFKI